MGYEVRSSRRSRGFTVLTLAGDRQQQEVDGPDEGGGDGVRREVKDGTQEVLRPAEEREREVPAGDPETEGGEHEPTAGPGLASAPDQGLGGGRREVKSKRPTSYLPMSRRCWRRSMFPHDPARFRGRERPKGVLVSSSVLTNIVLTCVTLSDHTLCLMC